ncbi:MAG TPA: peptidase T [Bacteroidia bacterium]|nr:peptidase T [Bacteroidia bacterium]HNU33904.1 peptidase T [Bacteroidia bacterium]
MSLSNYQHSTAERLIRYVQIDTTADPNSNTQPSSFKQKNLSALLAKELVALGVTDAHTDEHGYVYATIKSNSHKTVPVICFCSHVDTAPDCSGTNVKPIIHTKWDGSDIVLPDDNTIVISKKDHPYLKERIGDDIITASGLTLLGADDKAGIAIIMDFVQYILNNPAVKHGSIKILFTPDEEIGRGVNKVDMKKLGAQFGYTLDGGERATLEGENFSADACSVKFFGVSAHPGYAKDKMVNAQKVLAYFLTLLPEHNLSPETTEGYEGFVHPVAISGGLEEAEAKFILRDFTSSKLRDYKNILEELAKKTIAKYLGSRYEVKATEQYRNMKEVLDKNPQVMEYAEEAYKRSFLAPVRMNIRGGTDGARLSFMGMPCPNIFTGEMAIHSKQEYVSVQDMNKAVEVLVNLAQVWEEKS